MSFDTTSSNTGAKRGACTLLETKLGKQLLHLACRHHVFELVLEAVFSKCMGPSTGPDILLFKRFQKNRALLTGKHLKLLYILMMMLSKHYWYQVCGRISFESATTR